MVFVASGVGSDSFFSLVMLPILSPGRGGEGYPKREKKGGGVNPTAGDHCVFQTDLHYSDLVYISDTFRKEC